MVANFVGSHETMMYVHMRGYKNRFVLYEHTENQVTHSVLPDILIHLGLTGISAGMAEHNHVGVCRSKHRRDIR